jgi:hypothetical protein
MRLLDHPLVVFVVAFLVQWLAAWAGGRWLAKRYGLEEGAREDFNVILAAALTLLALIVGFSFSMAIGRYDQRKNLEEEEANAIGTEYVRADLLPAADAAKVRGLLRRYLDERILYYATRAEDEVREIDARTSKLQAELWAAVVRPTAKNRDPVAALILSGMNDVLNSQGYAQAAWWNRIPRSAWVLMLAIAVCCNILLGYGSLSIREKKPLVLVLPLVVSIAYLLIADIDSPRGGLIRVQPQNLYALAASLRAP